MSNNTKKLKSVVIIPKIVDKSNNNRQNEEKIKIEDKIEPKLMQKFGFLNNYSKESKKRIEEKYRKNDINSHKIHSKQLFSHCVSRVSVGSLRRHSAAQPLGASDDWPPLSHSHELMPSDGVRYWHQHECERCLKRFEHKHKQRGNQSIDYNKHICNVCGGSKGSRRVNTTQHSPNN